jgi:hypothetical protein
MRGHAGYVSIMAMFATKQNFKPATTKGGALR